MIDADAWHTLGAGSMTDLRREDSCAAIALPPAMADRVAGYQWTRDRVGESGAAVYRLHGRLDAQDLFLKHGRGAFAGDVVDEMVRLRWLARYIPVPSVAGFVASPEEAWLLMTAIPGLTAYQLLEARPAARIAIVDALAAFLRRLHAIPVAECPFNSDHAYRLSQARQRIDAGAVDEDDFGEEQEGWTAEQVWDAIQRLLPLPSDPVVTHGDFSLGNILMCDGDVVGCIDAGRVGIADRQQDLAILWSCLGEFDAALQERLIAQYGVPAADERKRRFHLLLDELF